MISLRLVPQEIFIGHPRLVAHQKPTEFRYSVTRLFELYNPDTRGLAVTGVEWNGKDRSILAAGYGCYLLSEDNKRGLVCCWSIKNPFQPERIYRLDRSVGLCLCDRACNLVLVEAMRKHLSGWSGSCGSYNLIHLRTFC